MELERKFVDFMIEGKFEKLPADTIGMIKNVVLNVLGAIISGATSPGCDVAANQVREWGGKPEATVLIHGGSFPAHNAVLVNSAMARALDIDDAMMPGLHIGASAIPVALAAAEIRGGCSGKEFITALAYGFEMAARINFASAYNGFDPSGVCGIFAAIAAGGKILGLNYNEMWDALGLGFNRPVQTFQSIVDGTLAVRVGQGFISQGAMVCIQLAQKGINGPQNFLEGVYGYFHLYAGDKYDPQIITEGLGDTYHLDNIAFKAYPSCGGTISSTDAILGLIDKYELTADNVAQITLRLTPYVYDMVGAPFKIGDNPRVAAQFSAQYCVANALLRRDSLLQHFDESYIQDPLIMQLIKKIEVIPDPALEGEKEGFSLRADMDVLTTSKDKYHISVPVPSGFPANPLKHERIIKRFWDAVSYAKKILPPKNIDQLFNFVDNLQDTENVCSLIPLMTNQAKKEV